MPEQITSRLSDLPENPLEGIEHLFAADTDPDRWDATVAGLPIFISFGPLDARADAAVKSRLINLIAGVERGEGLDYDELVLEVLNGACRDGQFVQKQKDAKAPGGWRWAHTPQLASLDAKRRKRIFAELLPEVRHRLVQRACEVAGLAPLLQVLGEMEQILAGFTDRATDAPSESQPSTDPAPLSGMPSDGSSVSTEPGEPPTSEPANVGITAPASPSIP